MTTLLLAAVGSPRGETGLLKHGTIRFLVVKQMWGLTLVVNREVAGKLT